MAGSVDYSSIGCFSGFDLIGENGLGRNEDGILIATNKDSWLLAHAEYSIRYLLVRWELDDDLCQSGDSLGIYFCPSFVEGSFSEDNRLSVPLLNKRKTLLVELPLPVHELRFDLTERDGLFPFIRLDIAGFASEEEMFVSLIGETVTDGVLVVSHELSNTGAPILARNLSDALSLKRDVAVLYIRGLGETELKSSFGKASVPLYPLIVSDYFFGLEESDADCHSLALLKALKKCGYRSVILNTVISGSFAGLFKRAGFSVVTLIHETFETMSIVHWERLARDAGMFSDIVVFPCDEVRDGFNKIVAAHKGCERVRPQGVYLDGTVADHGAGDALINELGISPNDFLVLGSGTVEMRKGTDLFISAASELCRLWGGLNRELHVIWVGEGEEIYLNWLNCQLSKSSGLGDVKIIPFMDAAVYKALLERSNALWSTSRNDTFPSVVLEAMRARVPVLAFSGAVGVDAMLSHGRGILLDDFSVSELAERTLDVARHESALETMKDNAAAWVERNLNFEDYVDYLLSLMDEPERIKPSYAEALLSTDWTPKNEIGSKVIPSLEQIRAAQQGRPKGIASFVRKVKRPLFRKPPVILDPSIMSDNIGDEVIAEYCNAVCERVFGPGEYERYPTHVYNSGLEELDGRLTILCGTNLIYTHMERQVQWAFPYNLTGLSDLCLLGVGMQDLWIEDPFSSYSVELFRYLLNNGRLHSVRDSYTATRLREIGIENVINTCCPTMWGLTPEHCCQIPHEKARRCLTTVTCHVGDAKADALMLETLRREYDEVLIWLQGPYDYKWCIDGVVDPTAYTILPPSLTELDRVLSCDDIEYVGTRLHAGIRALNHGRRSLIVAVDNRARHIAHDTGLPVMERDDLGNNLASWINGFHATEIVLPADEIRRWKSQF